MYMNADSCNIDTGSSLWHNERRQPPLSCTQSMDMFTRKFDVLLDNINTVYEFQNESAFMQQILDHLSDLFNCAHSVFGLQHPEGKTNVVLKNIHPTSHQQYQDYWYAKDPYQTTRGPRPEFRIIPGPYHSKRVISLEEIIPYRDFIKTDFYNDFFRLNKQHFKILVNLQSPTGMLGNITLTRPREDSPFTREEIQLIDLLVPYLVLAFENIKLRSQYSRNLALGEFVDENVSSGLLLCDRQMNIFYMNKSAVLYFSNILNMAPEKSALETAIPKLLREKGLFGQQALKKSCRIPAEAKSVLLKNGTNRYQIHLRWIEKREGLPAPESFYIIRCDEFHRHAHLDLSVAQQLYGITKREAEIVDLIFRGRKNREIADKLFVSENTVKNHIQNICEKLSTSNRTEIIYKIVQTIQAPFTPPISPTDSN